MTDESQFQADFFFNFVLTHNFSFYFDVNSIFLGRFVDESLVSSLTILLSSLLLKQEPTEAVYRIRIIRQHYALIEGAAAGSRSAAVQLVITVDHVCVGRSLSRLSRCELQSRRIAVLCESRATGI